MANQNIWQEMAGELNRQDPRKKKKSTRNRVHSLLLFKKFSPRPETWSFLLNGRGVPHVAHFLQQFVAVCCWATLRYNT